VRVHPFFAFMPRKLALAHALYPLTSGMNWNGRFTQWCDTLGTVYPRLSWRLADYLAWVTRHEMLF
jgi:hypothetical protein